MPATNQETAIEHTPQPLVSVIVPHYNHAAYLGERLASIRAQSNQDLELILLDDASTDGGAALLQEAAASFRCPVQVVVNGHNGGSPFKQWRKGIALARGRWIWIAESDDRCSPYLLERLLQLNARHGDGLGMMYCQSRVIDAAGNMTGSMATWTSNFLPDPFQGDFTMEGSRFLAQYLKVKNVVPNASAVLFRKELAAGAPLWENLEGMRMVGDWLFWSRILRKAQVGFLHEPLNDFRDHATVTRKQGDPGQRKKRLMEEAVLRNEWARTGQVEQAVEEDRLYEAWSRLVRFRQLLGREADRCRIYPRTRASYIGRLLRHKLRQLRAH